MGVMREWCPYTQREKTVPLINTEYRRKLITLLEENDLLPIHKLGEEMWRTDLFYNAETIPPYKFPIEYEKLYDDE